MSARRLREAVDRAVLAVADDRLPTYGDVTLLNRSAAAAPRPALQSPSRTDRLEPAGNHEHRHRCPAALALIAQDAVDLLLSAEIRRVRVCGADAALCASWTAPPPATAAGAPCPAAATAPRSASTRRVHERSGPTTEN